MKTEVFCANSTYAEELLFGDHSHDLLRKIVIKYLDYFYPNVSGNNIDNIDNKIEQAMDLVKSHLMYTVREEVEVLKEKIAELLERINQLEVENNFLRANVAPEVLTALNNGAAKKATITAGTAAN